MPRKKPNRNTRQIEATNQRPLIAAAEGRVDASDLDSLRWEQPLKEERDPNQPARSAAGKPLEKELLNVAFSLMTAAGLIARQNYTCCKLCATVSLSVLAAQAVMRGERCLGFAYYHEGDEKLRRSGENFWIGYGPSMDEELTILRSFDETAETVCQCLEKAGVPFRWNGDSSKRIEVLQNSSSHGGHIGWNDLGDC